MNVKNKDKFCKAANCDRNAICKELCTKHYQQQKLQGKLKEKNYMYITDFCKILGCGKNIFAKGLCQNHYLEGR